MVHELVVHKQLAGLLHDHGLNVHVEDEFVTTNLAGNPKFKAKVFYQEINGNVSSRLDVVVVTADGKTMIESFGDFAATVDDAINRNFQNFSLGSLHPILAAFGTSDAHTLQHVEIEEWVVNGMTWKAYLGPLVPKQIGSGERITCPPQFFEAIQRQIHSEKLTDSIHWFRSYFNQSNENVGQKEFLMDNHPRDADKIFDDLPMIPNVRFYSCRNFILLKKQQT